MQLRKICYFYAIVSQEYVYIQMFVYVYYQDFWKFSKIFINSEFFLPQTLGWRRRAEREDRAWGSPRETAKERGGSDEGGGGSEGN